MNFINLFVTILCFFSNGKQLITAYQEIGDSCNTSLEEKGVCIPQSECLKLDSKPANSDFAETCQLSVDGTPIICCVVKMESTNSQRDHVPTKSKSINENESDDNINSTNETESRIFTGPRKKSTTYSKSTNKITPKTAFYDQSTYKNYLNDYSKKSQNSESKYHSNSENDYDSTDQFTNFQSNYYNYETARPSNNPTYQHSSDVIFKPTKKRPNQSTSRPENNHNGYKPKPTRPTNENYGSSGEVHFPNENNQQNSGNYGSSDVNFPNVNHQQSNNHESNNVKYPNHNNQHGSSNVHYPSQNTKPGHTNSESEWGSTSNTRPSNGNHGSNHNTRPNNYQSNNNNNNNNNNHRVTEDSLSWGSTSRTTSKPFNTGGWSTNPQQQQQQQQQQRISTIKCTEYSKNVTSTISAIPLSINSQATVHRVSECRRGAAPLIVGGSKAELGEYPHMAALGFKSGSSITYNCGGSLISEDYVLTAAHCTHSSLGEPKHVRLGDLNLVRNDDGAQPQIINVANVIVHPNYKSPQLYNDIALIRLARKVSFNRDLRPACLQIKPSTDTRKVTAIGWGSINYGEITSDHLLKVGLDTIDNQMCNKLYGADDKLPSGIAGTMLCAGDLSGKKDTCQGDSGGPLQMQDPNNKCIHYIVGVTSFGRSCAVAGSPGIYTRVSEYVSWIEEKVWPRQKRH